MTKMQFIEEGKRRGVDKELLRKRFYELDAQGKFDDSTKVVSVERPMPQKEPSIVDRAGSFVGDVARGVGSAVKEVVKEPKEFVKGVMAQTGRMGSVGSFAAASPAPPIPTDPVMEKPEIPDTKAARIGAGATRETTKMAASTALFAATPGGWLAKGLVSELPFTKDYLKDKQYAAGAVSAAINLAVGFFTKGVGKNVIKKEVEKVLLENKIEQSAVSKIADEVVENSAAQTVTGLSADVPKKASGMISEGFKTMTESVRGFFNRLSPKTKEMAYKLDEAKMVANHQSSMAMVNTQKHEMNGVLNREVYDILDPEMSQFEAVFSGKPVVAKPVSGKAKEIAGVYRKEFDDALNYVSKSGVKEKLPTGEAIPTQYRENYVPRMKNPEAANVMREELYEFTKSKKVGKLMGKEVEWLLKTGQAKNQQQAITQLAGQFDMGHASLIGKIVEDLVKKNPKMDVGIAAKQALDMIRRNYDMFFGNVQRSRTGVTLSRDMYITDLKTLGSIYFDKAYEIANLAKQFPAKSGNGITEWFAENSDIVANDLKFAGHKAPEAMVEEVGRHVKRIARSAGDYDPLSFLDRVAGTALIGWNPLSPIRNVLRGPAQTLLSGRLFRDVIPGYFKALPTKNRTAMQKIGVLGKQMQRSFDDTVAIPSATTGLVKQRNLAGVLWNMGKHPVQTLKEGPAKPFMNWGEGFMRTATGFSAQSYMDDLAKYVWGNRNVLRNIDHSVFSIGKQGAEKALAKAHITREMFDGAAQKLSEEGLWRAAMHGANRSHGITGVLDLPRWNEHYVGKFMLTLQKMTFAVTNELGQLIREKRYGKFLEVAGAMAGTEYALTLLTSAIRHRNNPVYEPTEDEYRAGLQLASNMSGWYGAAGESMLGEGRRGVPARFAVPISAVKAGAALLGEGTEEKTAGEVAVEKLGRGVPIIPYALGK